jgi:hypothetical protein
VECLKGTFTGNLCPKCLLSQTRMRSKPGTPTAHPHTKPAMAVPAGNAVAAK